MRDILPGIVLAVFMGICISFVALLDFPVIITLGIQVILGIGIYIGGSAVLKLDSFEYLWGITTGYLKKENRGRQK